MDIHNGEGWLSRFIDMEGSKQFRTARAKALCARANLRVPLAQHEQACTDAEEGLNLFKANADSQGEVDCLLVMALVGSSRYDSSSKKELAKRALEISRMLGDSWRQAMSLNILGWTCNDQRQREYWEKSINLLRKMGDYDHLFVFLNDLANYEYSEGNYELAHLKFEELLQLSQSMRLNTGYANAVYARSILALMNGDYDKARAFLEDCVELMERIGDRMNNIWLRVRTGHVSVLQGEFTEARGILSQGAQDFYADKSENGLAFTLEGMANFCVRIGKYEQAARLIGWADAARKRVGDTRPHGEQADIDRIISACLLKIGEEVFSDAYDKGQKMTIDEAVSFALQED
jgi:tetratricopeptide (TPR) repeat protein